MCAQALIHKPNKKQAILFFIFTLLFAAGILAWIFFLNKGTILVNGDAPFTVRAHGAETLCEVAPCQLKLKPGSLGITIKKSGFYDYAQAVIIKRGEETRVTTSFRFIPTVQEIGEIITPTENAPLIGQLLGKRRFENFPKDAKNIEFSASGKYVLLTLGKELYEYDASRKELSKSVLAPLQTPAWLGDDLMYFSDLVLKRLPHGKEKGETVVQFERSFDSPRLLGASSGRYILIKDTNTYLVDINQKSRRRLAIETSQNMKWAGDYIIFEEMSSGAKKVFALNPETLVKTAIPAIDSENVIGMAPGIFIFVASARQEAEFSKLGPSIAEAIEEAKKESTESSLSNSTYYLTEFDMVKNSYRTLAPITLNDFETIHRLTANEDGKKLHFEVKSEKNTGRLFTVTLEPA